MKEREREREREIESERVREKGRERAHRFRAVEEEDEAHVHRVRQHLLDTMSVSKVVSKSGAFYSSSCVNGCAQRPRQCS